MLTQLSHPDSGVRADTLLCFLCQHLTTAATSWMELERSLAQECGAAGPGPGAGAGAGAAPRLGTYSTRLEGLVDQVFLQSGIANTFLNTVDMLALAPRNPQTKVLEALHGVLVALQQLRSSFATIIM